MVMIQLVLLEHLGKSVWKLCKCSIELWLHFGWDFKRHTKNPWKDISGRLFSFSFLIWLMFMDSYFWEDMWLGDGPSLFIFFTYMSFFLSQHEPNSTKYVLCTKKLKIQIPHPTCCWLRKCFRTYQWNHLVTILPSSSSLSLGLCCPSSDRKT